MRPSQIPGRSGPDRRGASRAPSKAALALDTGAWEGLSLGQEV